MARGIRINLSWSVGNYPLPSSHPQWIGSFLPSCRTLEWVFWSKGFHCTSVEATFAMDEPFYQKSSFLSYARKNEGLIERKRNSYIILMLCKKNVNDKFYVISILVDGQKSVAVKCQLWSNVPRSNVSCGQMSRGQMSLAVKRPAVKWHLRSNVPWSNISCGQMSRGQMSVAVKCPVVKCHLWSNVPWSNVTVVKCHKILKWSKVRGQMSRGQMRLWS